MEWIALHGKGSQLRQVQQDSWQSAVESIVIQIQIIKLFEVRNGSGDRAWEVIRSEVQIMQFGQTA